MFLPRSIFKYVENNKEEYIIFYKVYVNKIDDQYYLENELSKNSISFMRMNINKYFVYYINECYVNKAINQLKPLEQYRTITNEI